MSCTGGRNLRGEGGAETDRDGEAVTRTNGNLTSVTSCFTLSSALQGPHAAHHHHCGPSRATIGAWWAEVIPASLMGHRPPQAQGVSTTHPLSIVPVLLPPASSTRVAPSACCVRY